MVARYAGTAALILGISLAAAKPGRAQGILQQMQDEVSGIVHSARPSVVSIEEEPPPRPASGNGSREAAQARMILAGHAIDAWAKSDELHGTEAYWRRLGGEHAPELRAIREEEQRASRGCADVGKQLDSSPENNGIRAIIAMRRLDHLNTLLHTLDLAISNAKAGGPTARATAAAYESQKTALRAIGTGIMKQLANMKQTGDAAQRPPIPKSGSGFCIGERYVVTTADVLVGMTKPIIITDSGVRMHATIVGVDTDLNLGLLRGPDGAELPSLKMGDSDAVAAGHFAISIGNQSGQINSSALMLVSAIRSTGTFSGGHFYPTLMQISGTVGAGSSGAPIIDVHGDVIGMIAAIPVGEWSESLLAPSQPNGPFSPRGPDRRRDHLENATGGPRTEGGGRPDGPGNSNPLWAAGQGYATSYPWENGGSDGGRVLRPPVTSAGFAIPINDLQSAIHDLETTGRVERTWIGVDVRNDRQSSTSNSIIQVVHRLQVTGVYPNSPALRAGIKVDDFLVKMGDRDIHSMSDMRAAVIRLRPSETLHIVIDRNGQQQQVDLKIEVRPGTVPGPPSDRRAR